MPIFWPPAMYMWNGQFEVRIRCPRCNNAFEIAARNLQEWGLCYKCSRWFRFSISRIDPTPTRHQIVKAELAFTARLLGMLVAIIFGAVVYLGLGFGFLALLVLLIRWLLSLFGITWPW